MALVLKGIASDTVPPATEPDMYTATRADLAPGYEKPVDELWVL